MAAESSISASGNRALALAQDTRTYAHADLDSDGLMPDQHTSQSSAWLLAMGICARPCCGALPFLLSMRRLVLQPASCYRSRKYRNPVCCRQLASAPACKPFRAW